MNQAKEINIHLPTGYAADMLVADLVGTDIRVIVLQRVLLHYLRALPEGRQHGVFFLAEEAITHADLSVRIGMAEELWPSLDAVNEPGDTSWSLALMMLTREHSVDRELLPHVAWKLLREARRAGRYKVQVSGEISDPQTVGDQLARCLDVLEGVKSLLTTVGQPIFERVAYCGVGGVLTRI
jgi:hypothetical protein